MKLYFEASGQCVRYLEGCCMRRTNANISKNIGDNELDKFLFEITSKVTQERKTSKLHEQLFEVSCKLEGLKKTRELLN